MGVCPQKGVDWEIHLHFETWLARHFPKINNFDQRVPIAYFALLPTAEGDEVLSYDFVIVHKGKQNQDSLKITNQTITVLKPVDEIHTGLLWIYWAVHTEKLSRMPRRVIQEITTLLNIRDESQDVLLIA